MAQIIYYYKISSRGLIKIQLDNLHASDAKKVIIRINKVKVNVLNANLDFIKI